MRLGRKLGASAAGARRRSHRDPDRTAPAGPGLVVSPADGRVMIAGGLPGPGAPAGEWRQISIFLSPLDVHVNRTPVEGAVTHVEYHPGSFLPAYRVEAGHLNDTGRGIAFVLPVSQVSGIAHFMKAPPADG